MSFKENTIMMGGVLLIALALYLMATFHIAYGLLIFLLGVFPVCKIIK